jgi:hypothetical protein
MALISDSASVSESLRNGPPSTAEIIELRPRGFRAIN